METLRRAWVQNFMLNGGYERAVSARACPRALMRVRLDTNDHALGGLVVRSAGGVGAAAYIVAIRNSLSDYHCGIFKKVTGVWTAMTPSQSVCKVPLGGWHVVGAHVVDVGATDTRIEMLLDGVHILTWTDTSNRLAAGSLGLVTRSGAASFDDVTYHVLAGTNPDEFRTYYAFGAARLAVRHGAGASTGSAAPLYYLAADHLGSVSLAIQTNGQVIGTRAYYLPFGAERGTPASGLPTDRRYTGEIQTPYMELYQFGARWYSAYLNRWTQPDTIVPDFSNPQSLNRYSYGLNNPVKYIDSNGHCAYKGGDENWDDDGECWTAYYEVLRLRPSMKARIDWWGARDLQSLIWWFGQGVTFIGLGTGDWTGRDMLTVINGLDLVKQGFGGNELATLRNLGLDGPGKLLFQRVGTDELPSCSVGAAPNCVVAGAAIVSRGWIKFNREVGLTIDTALHEIAHVMDWERTGGVGFWSDENYLSTDATLMTHGYGLPIPGDTRWSPREQWANAVSVYLAVQNEPGARWHMLSEYWNPVESYFHSLVPQTVPTMWK